MKGVVNTTIDEIKDNNYCDTVVTLRALCTHTHTHTLTDVKKQREIKKKNNSNIINKKPVLSGAVII